MNDIDKMPVKCRDCAYWELATYPWYCGDCKDRLKKPVSDFVSRQWLIDEYHRRHEGPPGGALKMIEEAPAADVEEVKHGRWVRASGMMPPEAFGVYECSLCGYTQDYHIPARMRQKTPYCPWCGAKLEGNDNADK